jgi:hypothetical protein
MNWRKTIFWTLAVIITITTAIFQRVTGPTYPKSFSFDIDGKEYKIQLPRSQNGTSEDAMILLEIEDPLVYGTIHYRRFPTNDVFDTIQMHRENKELIAWLPKQKAAGKIEYGIRLFKENKEVVIQKNNNLILRYKDNVPVFILIPHILFIFTGMLLSTLTGFYAISGIPSYKFYTGLTLIMFLIGGMIMGPIVQKFAFGEYWAGFPFGKDLTDNKALIAFVFWVIAWIGNRKEGKRKYLVIIAAIVNLAIAFIPHSARGSELDYNSGEIKTGIIYAWQYFI